MPEASWGDEPEPELTAPRSRRRLALVLAASVLLGLAVLAVAWRITDRGVPDRQVALPVSVLGLPRDPAAPDQAVKLALAHVPNDLIDPHAGVYGSYPDALLVIAARAHAWRPGSQVEGFRSGFVRSGAHLDAGRDVPTGELGGEARCWAATLAGERPTVCVFADRGSLLATVDFLGGGVDDAARRGLRVREATVHARS